MHSSSHTLVLAHTVPLKNILQCSRHTVASEIAASECRESTCEADHACLPSTAAAYIRHADTLNPTVTANKGPAKLTCFLAMALALQIKTVRE